MLRGLRFYWLLAGLIPMLAGAANDDPDLIILFAVVNHVRKADVTLIDPSQSQDEIWIEQRGFFKLGIELPAATQRTVGGATFVLLPRSPQLQVMPDYDRLELMIEAGPDLLGEQNISLARAVRNGTTDFEHHVHGRLNYEVGIRHMSGDQNSFNLGAEPLIAFDGWSLRSQHAFESVNGRESRVRIGTSATHDWPDEQIRVTVGDVMPASTLFGRLAPLGGVSLSRVFAMNPGVPVAPTFGYRGSVTAPTTAEVLVDGARMATVQLQPGRYALSDLYYFAGLHDIEIRLTDSLGRENLVGLPFYFSGQQLRAGLQEFSYSAGMLRDAHRDDHYQSFGVTGWHRYGLSDVVTVSGNAEWSPGLLAIGGGFSGLMSYKGVATVDVEYHAPSDQQKTGTAAAVSYSFSGHRFSAGWSAVTQSRNFVSFRRSDEVPLSAQILNHRQSLTAGWLVTARDSVSLDVSRARYFQVGFANQWGIRYRRGLEHGSQFALGLRGSNGSGESDLAASVDLTLNLDRHWAVAASHESSRNHSSADDVVLNFNGVDAGEPNARLGFKRTDEARSAELLARQETRYGTAFAGLRRFTSETTAVAEEIRFAGSIAALGDRVLAGPRAGDSFALVAVDQIPGVRIYQNNQPIGVTDAFGQLYVPQLAPYAVNQLRVDDRDIPLDRKLSQVTQVRTPRAGMGSVVSFSAPRISAISLTLVRATNDGLILMDLLPVVIQNANQEMHSMTGPDGDVYLENVGPGKLRLVTQDPVSPCEASIDVPENAGPLAEFGTVECRSEK